MNGHLDSDEEEDEELRQLLLEQAALMLEEEELSAIGRCLSSVTENQHFEVQ